MSRRGLAAAAEGWPRLEPVAHPLKTLPSPCAYIWCRAEQAQAPPYLEPFRAAPGWRFRELATGHWPMASTPRELADLLLETATDIT